MAKVFIGEVVSVKMQKTLVVSVQTKRLHPLYKKLVGRSKQFKAHNELVDIKLGDTVKIIETRPLSAHKRFTVIEVVKKI